MPTNGEVLKAIETLKAAGGEVKTTGRIVFITLEVEDK